MLTVGPVSFAPGITIREIGWDDNVFDEPRRGAPKEDCVAAVQPDVSAFTRLRFVRISAYAGVGADVLQTSTRASAQLATRSARASTCC